MPHNVTLIPGDGIGEEIVNATLSVIEASGVKITWEKQSAGLCALEKFGSALPQKTIDSIKRNKVALKGPTTTPIGDGHQSANVVLRQSLNLYACIRPIISVAGVKTRYDNINLVIIRENTEGLYKGLESELNKDTVISLKLVTRPASLNIAKAAFKYAEQYHRKKITVGHKANILKMGDGLFLNCVKEIAANYKNIKYEEIIIDALCMKLVTNPNQFDILLLENLYGDILSDLCAGLVGGLGLAPGVNLGDDVAVFEAVHGSAPDIAGKNMANPTALMQSAVLMLDYLGESAAADKISRAINEVYERGDVKTGDLGGKASTSDFTRAVIAKMA